MTTDIELDMFVERARAWVAENVPVGVSGSVDGDINVEIFRNLSQVDERALINRAASRQQAKAAAGLGLLRGPTEHGGQRLDERYDAVVVDLEREHGAPVGHELVMVTVKLLPESRADKGQPWSAVRR